MTMVYQPVNETKTHSLIFALIATSCFVLAVLLPCLPFPAQPAFADSMAELEKQASSLESQHAVLESQRLALESEYAMLGEEQAKLDSAMAVLESKADAIRSKSSPYRQSSDKAVVALYKMQSSPLSLIDMVLDADSLQEAFDLVEYCGDVFHTCSDRIAQAHEAIASVEEQQEELRVNSPATWSADAALKRGLSSGDCMSN